MINDGNHLIFLQRMKLIADSGSTKTVWFLIDNNGNLLQKICTDGLNPFYQTEEQVSDVIEKQLKPQLASNATDYIYFYGAGCAFPEKNTIIQSGILSVLQVAGIEVNSDLLGAARGLCGKEAGIACILGTGSNSCFYQNGLIHKNVSPLGFILGDEGSGAVLGKKLIGDYLKNQLPKDLQDSFTQKYELSAAEILDRTYKQVFPNRYLASFVPFLYEHKSSVYVQHLVSQSFSEFFIRNVQQYDYQSYPVHFTGSVAYYFQDILSDVAKRAGLTLGKIDQSPMQGLLEYHK